MKLTFLGAAREVTGSCTLIEAGGHRFLVDCGMEQGKDVYPNADLPCAPGEIEAILLTHAHIDHSGRIPYLYKNGFRGPIYSTDATMDLCEIMLEDSAHIQEQEAEWKNRKAQRSGNELVEPDYTVEDAMAVMKQFVPQSYGKPLEVFPGITATFTDVGHLLGSASISLRVTEPGKNPETIVFSGDIGNTHQPLIKDPANPGHADYLIMESTYGDRLHKAPPDYAVELANVINRTLRRGGNLVIPAFAVGRTQEMLYFIREIKERKLVEFDFPVYVDSPLAIEATSIFNKNFQSCFDEEAMALIQSGISPIRFPNLHLAISSDESKAINFDSTPKVIISASGMCEAGRIKHHLKHNLWRPECTVLFVGYQAYGTLGRALTEGAEYVKLFGETIEVKAELAQLDGVSGHADKNGLLHWVEAFSPKPQMVFVVHGEDETCDHFAECLTDEHQIPACAPFSGALFDLATGEWIKEGLKIPVAAEKPAAKRKSDIYARLIEAGKRLMQVIYHNEGGANKDLAKFISQINSLCDKWDR